MRQTQDELKRHFREQLGFLKRSCNSYDQGFEDESKRIATVLRVLFHDTNQSMSLLGQLGVKDSLELFDSSSKYDPDNLISHDGLTGLRFKHNTVFYVPRLESIDDLKAKGMKIFEEWWNQVVIVDVEKKTFSRKKLILAVTNKDGGAHIDPQLDRDYANLTRENSMGWFVNDGVSDSPVLAIE